VSWREGGIVHDEGRWRRPSYALALAPVSQLVRSPHRGRDGVNSKHDTRRCCVWRRRVGRVGRAGGNQGWDEEGVWWWQGTEKVEVIGLVDGARGRLTRVTGSLFKAGELRVWRCECEWGSGREREREEDGGDDGEDARKVEEGGKVMHLPSPRWHAPAPAKQERPVCVCACAQCTRWGMTTRSSPTLTSVGLWGLGRWGACPSVCVRSSQSACVRTGGHDLLKLSSTSFQLRPVPSHGRTNARPSPSFGHARGDRRHEMDVGDDHSLCARYAVRRR
jgi:hypothetical protein